MRPLRSIPGVGPVALLLAVPACSGAPEGPPSAQYSAIGVEQRGPVFELATSLTEQRSSRARVYEEASRASGALLAPLLDADGEPIEGPRGTEIRSTCGVTFVSETDAITAAHCVASDNDLEALTVEMYRPTRALETGFLEGAALSGSFPSFEHTPLGPEQGYFVDRYPCRVVARCSEDFGGPIDCDASLAAAGDTALLRCEGRPGARYGFLNVARYDDPNADVLVPWKHEVYAAPADPESGYLEHYERVTLEYADNYHYFGAGPDGVEHHQLLPLIAPNFPDGTPHSKLGAGQPTGTDVFGCHGTSGSGMLQPGRGTLELLGPAAGGNPELGVYLCNHAPSFDGSPREPGAEGIGYVPLDVTRGIVDAAAAGCDPFSGDTFSLFTHFECVRRELTQRGDAFAAGFETPTAPSALDRTEQPVFLLESDSTTTLGEFTVRPDTSYRVEIHAWTADACSGTDCPSLAILAGGKSLVTQRVEGGAQVASVAATFGASGDRLELGLRARRGPFELSALTLRDETRVADFDDAGDRLAMMLQDPSLGEGYMPMRFVGDGKDGFEALLLPGERLVATRQALVAGRRWFVRFTRTSGEGPLRCGLLDADGAAVVDADCSAGAVVLDDRSGGVGRHAVFVDNAGSDTPSSLDDWLVVSDAAPDADKDGLPDVVDACPNHPPDQLTETMTESLCRPEPAPIRLRVPESSCDGLELSAALELVNSRALAEPIPIDPEQPEIELPLGLHRIRWAFRDALGNEQRVVTQNVRVSFEPGAGCCPSGGDLESPSSPFVEVSDGARCARLGEQGDFVSVASGDSFVAGGTGSDYLFSSGSAAVLIGDGGDDYLGAMRGTVALYGGEGADALHAVGTDRARLVGGSGGDTLVGGAGPDELIPGAGALLVAAGAGDDVIRIYDVCEFTPELLIAGGPGRDTVIAPIPRKDFERIGGRALDVELWVVDDTRRYLSACFTGL